MKHKISKRVVLALAMCAVCVLAFGATLAQASVDSGMDGANELQVSVVNPESDVKNAGAKANVYRVASASKDATYDTYNYTFDVAAFKKLEQGFNQYSQKSKSGLQTESWIKLAEDAKGIVDENKINPDASADVGETITGLNDGVYLVIIPDAKSDTNSYSFTPVLISLPGKVDANNKPVYYTDAGRWTNTEPVTPVKLEAKYSSKQLVGSLQINKTVTNFDGKPATFGYHIVDTETSGSKYENYAAVQYTAGGVQSTTVGGIPAGMNVTVTEVDSGARYQVVSNADQTATISAKETVSVNFENAPNGSGKVGHGIENHFVFKDDYNNGDWQLDVRAIDASEVVNNS